MERVPAQDPVLVQDRASAQDQDRGWALVWVPDQESVLDLESVRVQELVQESAPVPEWAPDPGADRPLRHAQRRRQLDSQTGRIQFPDAWYHVMNRGRRSNARRISFCLADPASGS